MRRALPLCLLGSSVALGACGSSSSPATEELPTLPAGLLRDPEDWARLPRPGRDLGCELGTPCARSVENVLAWARRWDDLDLFPDICESAANDNDHDVVALACALAWRATDDENWRERARGMIEQAVLAPYVRGGTALKPGRNLLSYVLAASTIELAAFDALLDRDFRAWIEGVAEVDRWVGDGVDPSGTFRDYQEERPNNVGLVVGAARIAVDMYLGGNEHARHVLEAQRVLRAFLGEESSFAFRERDFGGAVNDRSWQSEGRVLGVGPVGARIPAGDGVDVDGCLPEEMRRLGELDCIPCGRLPSIDCYNAADSHDEGLPPGMAATGYPWEALQGLSMQVYLLSRCGYDSFSWGDSALLRTHRFLYLVYGLRAQDTWNDATQPDDMGCCDGVSDRTQVDDTWVPHIVAAVHAPSFLDETNLVFGGRPGKNCGFADWWAVALD